MTYHYERRLDRALYHLDSLEAEVDAWLEKGPYRTWTDFNPKRTRKLFWVEVLREPPAHLSLIIGDCLHNLRSALDNLVFELALAYQKGPLSSDIEGKSAFPILSNDIAKDPESLRKFDNMTGGIDPLAKAEVEGLQPYKRGHESTSDSLWKLNKLSVMDKHRLPHVTLFAMRGMGWGFPEGAGVDEIEPILGPIEGRAPIARYPAFDDTGAEVNVQLYPAFSIGFGQRAPKPLRGRPVPDELRVIHWHITKKVLPRLTGYLT